MKMTFKRGFACGMITVLAFVGVYLTFFNHPPADETLQANAHNSAHKLGPPKFSNDIGPSKSNSADGSRHILNQEVDTAKRTKEKILRDQGTHPKDDLLSQGSSLANDPHGNDSARAVVNIDSLIDVIVASDQEKQEKSPKEPVGQISARTTAASENANGVKDDVKEVNMNGEKGGADTDGGGRSKIISHLDYPRFDWDKWVTDNNLVDVGTMWGYCDDPDPAEVGKILLMKDEDRGGLKVVVVMNTTFDEPVVSGLIQAHVMYGEMSFYDKEMDICTLYDDTELEPGEERDTFFDCPMAAGTKYYTKELHVPFFLPSGHFTAKAKLVDQQDRSVICTSAELQI
ncbi:uncharacterized protein LOC110982165 [Acanthaster planci]|uniref:Uncharacterized protein LOC110982165 n=1 Tax=Acanthaster planci TaxID=133434 RepID=A0A8B7YS43_ACAPL|nr:uncharacterized protein LOC110982165 [Acanthaster planci]